MARASCTPALAILALALTAGAAPGQPASPAATATPPVEPGDPCAAALEGVRRAAPGQEHATAGVTYLGCAGPRIGEGAAVDVLVAVVGADRFQEIMELRMPQLRTRLDVGHDDPYALAAVAFYALLQNTQLETLYAEKYLQEAEALDPRHPEISYLQGRVADRLGRASEAMDEYQRQITQHPKAPATRLAVNELAMLRVGAKAPAAHLEESLSQLDAELARTPREAAMHDTRARVLIALGRTSEALASLARSHEIAPSPELARDIEDLRSAIDAEAAARSRRK